MAIDKGVPRSSFKVPVALTYAGLGLILLIVEVVQRSSSNDPTAAESAED